MERLSYQINLDALDPENPIQLTLQGWSERSTNGFLLATDGYRLVAQETKTRVDWSIVEQLHKGLVQRGVLKDTRISPDESRADQTRVGLSPQDMVVLVIAVRFFEANPALKSRMYKYDFVASHLQEIGLVAKQ